MAGDACRRGQVECVGVECYPEVSGSEGVCYCPFSRWAVLASGLLASERERGRSANRANGVSSQAVEVCPQRGDDAVDSVGA